MELTLEFCEVSSMLAGENRAWVGLMARCVLAALIILLFAIPLLGYVPR